MSQEDKISSPHYGIYPFDPEAGGAGRIRESSPGNVGQSQERRKLSKPETWYTVQPGVTFRTGPEGSEVSEHGGRLTEPTKIRVIGKKVVRNGIASVYASFELDGQARTGWFSYDEIKSQNPSKRKPRTINTEKAVATGPKPEQDFPVIHVDSGTAYYKDLPIDNSYANRERLEDNAGGRSLRVAPSSLDEKGNIVASKGLKGDYVEVLDTRIQADGKKITVRRWVSDNRGAEKYDDKRMT